MEISTRESAVISPSSLFFILAVGMAKGQGVARRTGTGSARTYPLSRGIWGYFAQRGL